MRKTSFHSNATFLFSIKTIGLRVTFRYVHNDLSVTVTKRFVLHLFSALVFRNQNMPEKCSLLLV